MNQEKIDKAEEALQKAETAYVKAQNAANNAKKEAEDELKEIIGDFQIRLTKANTELDTKVAELEEDPSKTPDEKREVLRKLAKEIGEQMMDIAEEEQKELNSHDIAILVLMAVALIIVSVCVMGAHGILAGFLTFLIGADFVVSSATNLLTCHMAEKIKEYMKQ